MAGAGKYASTALLLVVMIMVGAGASAAAEVTAASPSPTLEAGTASMAFLPPLFAAVVASFIPFFLASRLY